MRDDASGADFAVARDLHHGRDACGPIESGWQCEFGGQSGGGGIDREFVRDGGDLAWRVEGRRRSDVSDGSRSAGESFSGHGLDGESCECLVRGVGSWVVGGVFQMNVQLPPVAGSGSLLVQSNPGYGSAIYSNSVQVWIN